MPDRQEQLRGQFAMLVGQVARHWWRRLDRRLQPFGLSEAT
jgi:MarR family transcriptional regulator for hemolysin